MDEREGDDHGDDGERRPRPSLKTAIRRARIDAAAHSEAVDDLRRAERARLELIEDAIRPVLSEAPKGTDLFDLGIAQGDKPRLFLDMIAYVDLGPDRRTYRFHQNTRHGRVVIAENARVDRIVASMTNYIARRLIEREQALESDLRGRSDPPPRRLVTPETPPNRQAVPPAPPPPGQLAAVVDLAGFLLMTLGAFTLFALGALAVWLLVSAGGRAILAARLGLMPP